MFHDLRHAIRAIIRMPGFSATAILTLALGIGANTAIFSVVYALLLKPLPFKEPGRLIYVHDTYPAVASASVSWQKFVALRDGNRTLASLTAVAPGTITMTGHGEAQQLAAYRVSGDFFDVFGVSPLAGRWMTREDDVPNGHLVIVIGYTVWQRIFGGRTDIVGQTIIGDGQLRTIVGVMPAGFNYPGRAEAWVPLAMPANAGQDNFLRLIGRMKPGVSLPQATGDLKAVTAGFNRENGLNRGIIAYALHDFLSRNNRQMLLVLQGAVLIVLLVACANVANMLLARSVARRRELSIRAAIGAGPGRLLRQLLTESLLLSVVAAGVGVLLASWLLRLFLALAPAGFAGVQTIAIDNSVLSFTVIVAVLAGVMFGVAPARRGFRLDASDGLRDGARGGSSGGARGASRLLVVAEIALATVLAIGAALMVKSLAMLQAQDAGFRADGLLTFQLNLPAARYDDDASRRVLARAATELRAVPGVKAVGAINWVPLQQFGFNAGFSIVGRPPLGSADRPPVIEFRMILPGYFAAMDIPVRRGADFSDRDTASSAPVVIINETMAKQFWPNENPIGARVRLGLDPAAIVREVVGVAGDVRSNALSRPPVPESFVPYAQVPSGSMSLILRVDGDPAFLLPAVRQRIAAIDPDLPIVRPQTMNAVVEASAGPLRLSSTLSAGFALLAAALATIGIYSVVSYSVAQRTREIGIRVALGASAASVLRLVMWEGVALALAGLGAGLAGTRALTASLKTLLYEVSPADPLVLAATSGAVLLVTAAACLIPARRVLRVDPTVALRAE
jgi:putative ABC transport system permease protein